MLVNLLLQDGRANYMEGVMCELPNVILGGSQIDHRSDRIIPRHCSQLYRLGERAVLEEEEEARVNIYPNIRIAR